MHPDKFEAVVGERTELIGMGQHYYLCINPPTSMFVVMVNTGPPYNRVNFFELINRPTFLVKKAISGVYTYYRTDRKVKKETL